MKTVGDSRAENPRAVEVWEVTRAAEHATPAQRAEALAMLTGERIPVPLDDLEEAVLGALAEMPRGVPASVTRLVAMSGYRNRHVVSRVLRGLEHLGLARRKDAGWVIRRRDAQPPAP